MTYLNIYSLKPLFGRCNNKRANFFKVSLFEEGNFSEKKNSSQKNMFRKKNSFDFLGREYFSTNLMDQLTKKSEKVGEKFGLGENLNKINLKIFLRIFREKIRKSQTPGKSPYVLIK